MPILLLLVISSSSVTITPPLPHLLIRHTCSSFTNLQGRKPRKPLTWTVLGQIVFCSMRHFLALITCSDLLRKPVFPEYLPVFFPWPQTVVFAFPLLTGHGLFCLTRLLVSRPVSFPNHETVDCCQPSVMWIKLLIPLGSYPRSWLVLCIVVVVVMEAVGRFKCSSSFSLGLEVLH